MVGSLNGWYQVALRRVNEHELTWVCNAYCEEFVKNITDYFNRMTACLVTNWVLDEQPAASKSTSSSDFRVVVFKIRKCSVSDKLIQDMT
jgi:hypothetical protein